MVVCRSRRRGIHSNRRKIHSKRRTFKRNSRRTGQKNNRTRRRRRKRIQSGGFLSWNRHNLFYKLDLEEPKYEKHDVGSPLNTDYMNSKLIRGYLFDVPKHRHHDAPSGPNLMTEAREHAIPLGILGGGVAAAATGSGAPLAVAGASVAALHLRNVARRSYPHQECVFVSYSNSDSDAKNTYFTDINLGIPQENRSDGTVVTGVCYASGLHKNDLTALVIESHKALHSSKNVREVLPDSTKLRRPGLLRTIDTSWTENITDNDGKKIIDDITISQLRDDANRLSKKAYHRFRGEYGILGSTNCRRFAKELFSSYTGVPLSGNPRAYSPPAEGLSEKLLASHDTSVEQLAKGTGGE